MRFFIGDKEKIIVKRLHGGDKSAMQDFYTLYADYLTSVCARYVDNDDDLKDVLQDSMVKMLTGIGQFDYRGPGSLQAWQRASWLTNRCRSSSENARRPSCRST